MITGPCSVGPMLALTAFATTDRTHSPRAPVVAMIRTPHALVPVTKLRWAFLTTTSDHLQRCRWSLRSQKSPTRTRRPNPGVASDRRITSLGRKTTYQDVQHHRDSKKSLLETHSPADARLATRSGDQPRNEPDALRSCRRRRETIEPWQATSFLELGKVVVLSAEDGTRALHFVLSQAGPRLPQDLDGASLRGSDRARCMRDMTLS